MMRECMWIAIAFLTSECAPASDEAAFSLSGDRPSIDKLDSRNSEAAGTCDSEPPTRTWRTSNGIKIGDQLVAESATGVTVIASSHRLTLIRLDDPQNPSVLANVELPGSVVDLHIEGTTVILSQVLGPLTELVSKLRDRLEGSALTAIDITDPRKPKVHRLRISGEIRMTHVLKQNEQLSLFSVVDNYSGSCKAGTRLVGARFVGDHLQSTYESHLDNLSFTNALRTNVTAVHLSEDSMIVARYLDRLQRDADAGVSGEDDAQAEAEITLLQLLPEGTIRLGPMVTAPVAATAIARSKDTFRIAGSRDDKQLIAATYRIEDHTVPRLLGTCEIGSRLTAVGVIGDLAFGATSTSVSINSWDSQRGCQTTEHAAFDQATLLSGRDSHRALYLSSSRPNASVGEQRLSLQWFDTSVEAERALLSSSEADTPARAWSPDQTTSVMLNSNLSGSEDLVFFVPWRGRDEGGVAFEALQPFRITDQDIDELHPLKNGWGVLAYGSNRIAMLGRDALTTLTTETDGWSANATIALRQSLDQPLQFDAFIARVAARPQLASTDRDAIEDSIRVDFRRDDRQLGYAVSVPYFAQLMRGGRTLIALTPKPAPEEEPLRLNTRNARLTVDLVDLTNPEAPSKTGHIEMAWPGTRSCTEKCDLRLRLDAVTTSHALVLPDFGAARIQFKVVDLTHPSQPRTVALDRDGPLHLTRSFSRGETVYYGFLEVLPRADPDGGPEGGPPPGERLARYYAGALDVTHSEAPFLTENIRTPGEVLAVSSEALFTSELTRENGVVQRRIHKVALNGDRGRVMASRSLGEVALRSVWPDDEGHVIAEVMGPDWRPDADLDDWGPATTLLILDEATLDEIARVELDRGMVLRDVRNRRAVFQGVGEIGGIGVFDLRSVSDPRLLGFDWTLPTDSDYPTLLFDGTEILAADGYRRQIGDFFKGPRYQ